MDFGIEKGERQVTTKRVSHQPLGGGAPEIMNYRDEKYLVVGTGIIQEANLLQWREFLSSVSGGEVFTFDRYGTNAAPVEAKSAILASEQYAEVREGSLYPGRYRLSFSIRLLN
jgi:hypothetical protein